VGWTSTSAAAILAAKPSLARDSFELGDRLESEFSSRGDIDQDDFLRFFHEAICQGGEAPPSARAARRRFSCWCSTN